VSHHDYECSKRIAMADWPFYALIMAAMRQADTANMRKLAGAFPGVYTELQQRYDAPGGYLVGETPPQEETDDDRTA
jgi:hypothetical protein